MRVATRSSVPRTRLNWSLLGLLTAALSLALLHHAALPTPLLPGQARVRMQMTQMQMPSSGCNRQASRRLPSRLRATAAAAAQRRRSPTLQRRRMTGCDRNRRGCGCGCGCRTSRRRLLRSLSLVSAAWQERSRQLARTLPRLPSSRLRPLPLPVPVPAQQPEQPSAALGRPRPWASSASCASTEAA